MTAYSTVTMEQAQERMKTLREFFQTVRLLEADEIQGELKASALEGEDSSCGHCYDYWKKGEACRNCISRLALQGKTQKAKLEMCGSDICHVISKYMVIDGKEYVMELIGCLNDDCLIDFYSRETLVSKLNVHYDEIYKDVLTDSYNRRFYEEQVKNRRTFAGVAMIDLDDFKLYNDIYGHSAGDKVLCTIAGEIRKSIRKTDRLIRYGGDEFLLIMPGIPKEIFAQELERIRLRINEINVPGYSDIRVAVSVGGAVCENETIEDTVDRADRLMYLAKMRKNMIVTEDDMNSLEIRRKRPIILVVDDSEMNRELLSRILQDEYNVIEARNGEECISTLDKYGKDISLVLLDIIMPGVDGFGVLEYMTAQHLIESIPVITITGDDSETSVRRAYEMGASDYISRPFDTRVVYRRVSNTIKLYAKQRRLVSIVANQIVELEKNNRVLMGVFSRIEEFRDGRSVKNPIRVVQTTKLLLDRLISKTGRYHLNAGDVAMICTASSLHDIGKLGIEEKILAKPGALTPEEYETVKWHTEVGARLIGNLGPYREELLVRYAYQICRWHHERYDGSGYPDGLVGDNIPITAQVVSVADVYDALLSDRVYQKAYSHEKAIRMILNGECGVFNPLLMECLEEIQDKLRDLQPDMKF